MGITTEIIAPRFLLGRVQPPLTTLQTLRLLVALALLSNSSRKSSMTFLFLTFYSFAVFEIQPIGRITIISSALCSATDKLVKTTIFEIEITLETISSKKISRKCATTIKNIANGALTSVMSAFLQLFLQIFNEFFVSNF